MGSRFEDRICQLVSLEPVTPSEVAKRVGVACKTAQRALMHLALTKKDVAYKNSGRIHWFYKECGGTA